GNVMPRDLILQRSRSRGHDDALAALQRGHEIRERLACTGARLDDQRSLVGKRARNGCRHRTLLGAIFIIRNRSFEATAGCEQVHYFFRVAFSVCPLVPNRRASSSRTRSTGILRAVRPTIVWKIRSAAS